MSDACARARAGEHVTFSPLSLSGRRRDLHVAAALGLNLRMHIQDTNVLNPGRINSPTRVATLRPSEGDDRGGAGAAGCIKTGYFIIFHIDKSGRGRGGGGGGGGGGREGGREAESNDENNGRRWGPAGWSGAEGEGLTAINFAKIGAYAVAGRQSNPSSALPPLR